MRHTTKRLASGLMLCTGFALGVAGSVQAQSTFQAVYGNKQNDAARGGTIRTSDGGILTVGESNSFSFNGDYDLYVVKTDDCGNLQWAATYDLGNGGDDFGRKVRETVDGNFVIVGSTDNIKACCTHKGADIFVLNIDSKGNVNWGKTYGGFYDDQGTNIELYNGGKEYVVSGRTASFGAGQYDGYLMRIDFVGDVIWGRAYGGQLFDSFNSLTVSATGDILATGETYSYSPAGVFTDQIWIARVDANGSVQWSYHYGSPKTNEAANDIVEIDKEFIAVVGWTDAITGTRDPYVLKVFFDGNCVCDNAFFNIEDVTNDQFNEVENLLDGDLAIVGTNTSPVYGLGGSDLLFAIVNVKCDLTYARHYGDFDNEEGHSLAIDRNAKTGGADAFTFAGMTLSCCFGNEDLYLVRADAAYNSGCNEKDIKMDQKPLQYCPEKAPTCEPLVFAWCDLRSEPLYNDWWKPICQNCIPPFMPGHEDGGRGHLGANPSVQDQVRTANAKAIVRSRIEGSNR